MGPAAPQVGPMTLFPGRAIWDAPRTPSVCPSHLDQRAAVRCGAGGVDSTRHHIPGIHARSQSDLVATRQDGGWHSWSHREVASAVRASYARLDQLISSIPVMYY